MAAASEKLKVVVFIGSVRENRLGTRVAKFVQKALQKKDFEVDVFGTFIYVLTSFLAISSEFETIK